MSTLSGMPADGEQDLRTTQRVYQFGALAGELRIESGEALRALSHPIRSAILRELARPRSVREVAEALDQPVARLYHHVKQLLAHGFIREVEQRRAGSNTESVYQVAAGRIEVAAELTRPWGADDAGSIVEEAGRRFASAFREDERRRLAEEDPWPLDPWFFEAITHLGPEEARQVVDALREALREVGAQARRPVRGRGAPPQPRVGFQVSVVSFPPDREHRYAEMRTSAVEPPGPARGPRRGDRP